MSESSEESNDGVNLLPEEEEPDLQRIILERRTERRLEAEQRRQSDLRRIQEMNSTVGIDPLEQFPKEIWERIFDELGPEDLNNVWKVHPVFQELLKDIRNRDILLPLVLLKVDTFRRVCFKEAEEEEGDSKRDLRLISKSVMKSYDRRVEENLVKQIEQDARTEEWDEQDHYAEFRLNDSYDDNLSTALANFGDDDNPAKKIFVRGLSIFFTEYDMGIRIERKQELRKEFNADITSLLQFIGDQIWHFQYFVMDMDQESLPFSLTQAYVILHEWIRLMPNLKWLELGIHVPFEAIEALIQERPFHHLPSLERLSFNPETQIEIYEAVIAANSQLKSLDFNYGDYRDFRLLPVGLIKSLEGVTKISLTTDGYNHRLDVLKCIKSIVNYSWSLRTITLEYFKANEDMNSIFQFLNKFTTLERIKLGFLKGYSIGDTDSYGYLNLPNLTSIRFSIEEPVIDYNSNLHFFFSLQFLIHCKKLTEFHWYFRGVEDHILRGNLKKNENPQKTTDFRAGLRFLYDSNIWDVFPALDKVRADLQKCRLEGGERTYSRDCYHEYHRTEKGEKVTQFLKRHSCFRHDRLQDCVVVSIE